MPLAETGRVWSAVHHNIKYRSRQYLHQLALRLFGLEVQAAENARADRLWLSWTKVA